MVGVPQVAAAVNRAARAVAVVVGLPVGQARGQPKRRRRAQTEAQPTAYRLLLQRIVADPARLLAERSTDRTVRRLAGTAPGEPAAAVIVVAHVGAGAQERRLGPRGRGDHLDRARQRTRSVERGQRTAHDLQALDLRRADAAQRKGAAVLVRAVRHRHAVDQNQREVRVAAAQGRPGQSGARIVAQHPGAWDEPQSIGRIAHREVLQILGFHDLDRGRRQIECASPHGGRLVVDRRGGLVFVLARRLRRLAFVLLRDEGQWRVEGQERQGAAPENVSQTGTHAHRAGSLAVAARRQKSGAPGPFQSPALHAGRGREAFIPEGRKPCRRRVADLRSGSSHRSAKFPTLERP